MTLLIKNGIIISDEFSKNETFDLYIENGKIAQIAKSIDIQAENVIDATNKVVMPGFIDMYCKICESGFENKDNIKMICEAAKAGGFTSISINPKTQPIIDTKATVEYIQSKTKSDVNFLLYGSITKNCKGKEISELGEMILAGVVALSDGGNTIDNSALLRNIFLYSKMFKVPIITNCYDNELIKDGVINYGYISTKLGLKGILREAEEIHVARNIILAKYTDAKVHLAQITTRGSVDLIRDAKAEGVNITCSTCPHYFSLTEDALENYNTFAKINPPLRTYDDIKAIKEGLLDGTIDVIASGHSPVLLERKISEFDKAPFGISSLETTFGVSYTELVNNFDTPKLLDIHILSKLLSENPAEILGLKTKGKIKVGFDADLVLVDVNKEYKVDTGSFKSRAKYSLYDKVNLKCKIHSVIIDGKEIL